MITNLLAPVIQNDKAINGISRSRLSLHFNTAHKRRWLMVQLVTAPAIAETETGQAEQPTPYAAPKPERTDYRHLIDGFQDGALSRRCV